MKNFLGSWKTSLCGLVGALLVGLSQQPTLENGTGLDWLKAAGAVAVPLLFGLFSADADKSEK